MSARQGVVWVRAHTRGSPECIQIAFSLLATESFTSQLFSQEFYIYIYICMYMYMHTYFKFMLA